MGVKEDVEHVMYGPWRREETLGSGGNGNVYRVSRPHHSDAAIKIPQKRWWREGRYERFKSEVEGMRRCGGIEGVLPLLDQNIPGVPSDRNPPWLVMGLAIPLEKELGQAPSLKAIVQACYDIATSLAMMHQRGISHRDIKPDNLFRYEGRWAVGDLGLVDFEDKATLTAEGEKLGPMHYIAPEMLNGAADAEGRYADVYSLGKTLWKLASGQRFPLPGEMRRTVPALTISSYVDDSRASLLDGLLESMTQLNPTERPAMADVAAELGAWLSPPPRPIEGGLDLSDFAREIGSINELHYVQERRNKAASAATRENGTRIREAFRTVFDDVLREITDAGFLSPHGSFDNHHWGFEVHGYVMATAWHGEVTLRLACAIQMRKDGKADTTCKYVASWEGDPHQEDMVLWQASESFLMGGSSEEQALGRLVTGIRSNLRCSVRRLLEVAEGQEGAPPIALAKK